VESKCKIEIIQTGITTSKVFLNGQDISNVVSEYTLTHRGGNVPKLELIVGKEFTNVMVDEICEVTVRQEVDENAD